MKQSVIFNAYHRTMFWKLLQFYTLQLGFVKPVLYLYVRMRVDVICNKLFSQFIPCYK